MVGLSWWETGPKSSLDEDRYVISDEHLERIINLILSSVLCCVYFCGLLFGFVFSLSIVSGQRG